MVTLSLFKTVLYDKRREIKISGAGESTNIGPHNLCFPGTKVVHEKRTVYSTNA